MKIIVKNIDAKSFSESQLAVFRSRVIKSVDDLARSSNKIDTPKPDVFFDTSIVEKKEPAIAEQQKDVTEYDVEKRAENYTSVTPSWTFDRVILTEKTTEDILLSLSLFESEKLVFDEWGLRKIEPFPRSSLNFHGSPGTGKTMAAHAIADKLGKKIIITNYAQIESMYHGVGPKNIDAVFKAAERDNSVLFIDEADSLLSKRLLNVNQGSEQAINSMRSQLLINLERFTGICIFATNLVKNYDYAFETRVKHINFQLPDEETRYKIWQVHILDSIPKSGNIDLRRLASIYVDFCGRDIKNAVIEACLRAVKSGFLTQEHLEQSCESIKISLAELNKSHSDRATQLPDEEKSELANKIVENIEKSNSVDLTLE
jgi:SpoVK/Ycf46/Vps4 family AAA+-type ATPase